MKPDGENIRVRAERIESEDGVSQESAPHACQVIYVTVKNVVEKDRPGELRVGDLVRADAKDRERV